MRKLLDGLQGMDHYLLVARASLVILIVNARDQPIVMVVVAAAAVFLIPRPDLLRRPWPWFVLGGVVGVSQALEWWHIDDHVVVTTYWTFAVGISRLADRPERFLSVSARLLVGLVFAFAFGWKLLSSQYTSTEFFQYEFLFDDRFALVSEHVAGNDPGDLTTNVDRVNRLVVDGELGDSTELAEGPRNETVAAAFTWWGLLVEGAVAAAFLLPLRGRSLVARDGTLLVFAGTTYAVVPIAGFGVLLTTLGLAHRDTPRRRIVYTAAFVALMAWGFVFRFLI